MKMVKSLLLGSAAGLVAVAGAQAADLPVKAKPVQYVKICSLYGVGFYYVPGTDLCLKVGGWVRAEYAYGSNGSMTWGPYNDNRGNRETNGSVWRARGYITADARSQTEYGTVRGYIAVGVNSNDVNGADNSFTANRAFIQWAGFTFGLAQSFFDFYSVPATSYWGTFPAADTGDPGWKVLGYTAQFGNGFSATIAAEMRRMTQIIGSEGTFVNQGTLNPGAFANTDGAYGGFEWPDIVANLRVDQAWGSAQIMGALHNVNATYYNSPINTWNGHPDDELGFAIGAGVKVNVPMAGPGDYFQAQGTYSQGALRYIFQTPNTNWGKVEGAYQGWGVLSDAVFTGVNAADPFRSDLELTTGWGVNAAYEHFWNPRWRTSLYGGYAAVSYNDLANGILCGFGNTANPGANAAAVSCDMDWQTWWVGSRTQWNVTKEFYMGVDVLYQKIQSATWGLNAAGTPITFQGFGGQAFLRDDLDNIQVRFRVHRDFYP
jgi:hypothetical protein